jgi:hypothetical protein
MSATTVSYRVGGNYYLAMPFQLRLNDPKVSIPYPNKVFLCHQFDKREITRDHDR